MASRRIRPNAVGSIDCPYADIGIADGLHLPYRCASCDAAMSIAVIHHMSSVSRRVALLDEITRILKIGGRAIITAWATEQQDMAKLTKWHKLDPPSAQDSEYNSPNDYLVPWHVPLHRAEAASLYCNSSNINHGGEVDLAKNSIVFKRYYHLFAPGELERLVSLTQCATLVDSFYDRDNWCIIIQRKE